MKLTILTVMCSLFQASPAKPRLESPKPPTPVQQKQRVRVTFYTADKQSGWGVAMPGVRRAKEGLTVAAHPKHRFGSKLHIPKLKGIVGDGNFVVQDRGSAVTKKRASKGKTDVVDVFVATSSKLNRYAKNLPEYMDVYWIKE